MQANASQHAIRDYDRITRQILGEVDEVDRDEDERHGHSAVMSCRRSSPRARAASAGCVAPSAIWMTGAPPKPGPIARSRQERLKEAKRRLEEEWRSNAPQVQPRHRLLPTPRALCRALGMATDHREFEVAAGVPWAVGDQFGLEGVDEALGHRVDAPTHENQGGMDDFFAVWDRCWWCG
jgi:hypothetical protein